MGNQPLEISIPSILWFPLRDSLGTLGHFFAEYRQDDGITPRRKHIPDLVSFKGIPETGSFPIWVIFV